MAGTSVRILLARHGETEANVEGRWQGHADSPLTERGREQVARLADALADEPVAAVYTSDLGRALETARPISERHDLEPIVDRRLREIDTGDWTGRYGTDIHRDDPAGMDAWRTRPWTFRLPGGETLADVRERARAFFAERLPEHPGETIVVVAHGTIGQTIVVDAMGLALTDMWLKDRIDNCQVSRLEWRADTGLSLVELCDVRHLAEVGSLKGWRAADTETA